MGGPFPREYVRLQEKGDVVGLIFFCARRFKWLIFTRQSYPLIDSYPLSQ